MKKRVVLAVFFFIFVHMLFFVVTEPIKSHTAIHLVNITLFTIAIILLCKVLKVDIKNCFYNTKMNINNNIIWVVIGFLVAMSMQFIAIYIRTSIIGVSISPASTESNIKLITQNYLAIISPLLIVPIFEELIFRKVIFKEIYQKYPFWFAGSISSILFAIIHVDLINIILYYLIGMVLAYVYKRTNNILVPITTHILLNAVPILLVLI